MKSVRLTGVNFIRSTGTSDSSHFKEVPSYGMSFLRGFTVCGFFSYLATRMVNNQKTLVKTMLFTGLSLFFQLNFDYF